MEELSATYDYYVERTSLFLRESCARGSLFVVLATIDTVRSSMKCV